MEGGLIVIDITKLETPSGGWFDSFDLHLLKMMHDVGFIKHNDTPFTLKSGIKSNVYVFGREDLTDNPGLEWLIGSKLLPLNFWLLDSGFWNFSFVKFL